jgi:hypothetical protein
MFGRRIYGLQGRQKAHPEEAPLGAGRVRRHGMNNDLFLIGILVAFFALAVLFVKACDAIIGPDEEALPEGGAGDLEPEAVRPAA